MSNKYGEYADTYSLNKKWFSLLEATDTQGLTFGFFGETLRTLEQIDTFYKKPYSLRNMIRDIYCRNNIEKNTLHSDTIYDFIESEMLPLNEGMNTSDMTRDDIYKLFTYSRFGADAMLDNFANMFTYSFIVFAQKAFADANFSIPYEWREGDYFSLSLTKKFCPKLLEVPFFSHHHFVLYDPATNTVRSTAAYEMKSNFVHRVLVLHNRPRLYMFLRNIYGVLKSLRNRSEYKQRRNINKIFKAAAQIIRESPTIARSKLKPIGKTQFTRIAKTAASVKIADTLIDD